MVRIDGMHPDYSSTLTQSFLFDSNAFSLYACYDIPQSVQLSALL